LAKGLDLNNRIERIRVAAAGFSQVDVLAFSFVVLRLLVYLAATAIYHDSSDTLYIAVIFSDCAVVLFTAILCFRSEVPTRTILRLFGDVLLILAGIGGVYVNGVITEYLEEVQMRASVIVLLVIFNILFAVVECARTIFTADVLLAASTARHRKSPRGEFKKHIRPLTEMIGCVLCVVFLALPAFFGYKVVSSLDSVSIDERIYQVDSGEYVFYDYPATVRKQGGGCIIVNDEKEKTLVDSPLYFGQDAKTSKILLPTTYAIIQPAISSSKKVDNLSLIEAADGKFNISNESGEREAGDFFLYDGRNTYIFFEETQITVGDKTFTIAPFSYLTASYNQAMSVFDPSNASCSVYSLIGRDAYATMKDGTRIDVSMDILFKNDGVEQMLFVQPSTLGDYLG